MLCLSGFELYSRWVPLLLYVRRWKGMSSVVILTLKSISSHGLPCVGFLFEHSETLKREEEVFCKKSLPLSCWRANCCAL